MMTKAVTRADMAEEVSSNDPKPICVFFKKNGKCHRASCELKYSHTMNTEVQSEFLKENGSGDRFNSATKRSPEESRKLVISEKMASSQVKSELERSGRPHEGVNEEELRESLKCELLEKCTPQFCWTCEETFVSEDISKAHYAGKPHQRLLQMKLKVMLRKKLSEENWRMKQDNSEFVKGCGEKSRRIQGNSELVKSGIDNATEIKQFGTAELSQENVNIKEETQKRPSDHLDETYDLTSDILEMCGPTYCGVCYITLNENDSRPHYAGKNHKKKLNLMENMGKPHKKKVKRFQLKQNSNIYMCSLCQVPTTSKESLEIHRQGSKHKSKEAQEEALRPYSGIQIVTTKQNCSGARNAVMALNEFATLNGYIPLWTLVSETGPPHLKVFTWHLQVGQYTTQGKGSTKKMGKCNAAEEMLKVLSEQKQVFSEETILSVEAEKTVTQEAKKSSFEKESLSVQTATMRNKNTSDKSVIKGEELNTVESLAVQEDNSSENSVIKAEKMDDGEAKDIPDLRDSMEENYFPGTESTADDDPDLSDSIISSFEGYVDTDTSEKSIIKDEKMDDSEVKDVPDLNEKTGDTKSIPDFSDSVIMNLKQLKDRHKEFMSMQAEEMMFGNASKESVIKDEEMDDIDTKNIPELSDSPINKLGHSETDTEPMSVKAKDDSEEKDVPDLCDSMCDRGGHSDLIKNNELKIKLNLKYKELLHPPEIDKSPKIGVVSVTEAIEVKKSVKDGDEKEVSSDDDLIILENPDSLSPKNPVQNTPKLNNTPVVESVKLCVYPLGQSESVTVSTQDYSTLAYDTFLNDIIIDFYLLYLSNTVLPNADKENVYIFSTMFYKRLLQKPGTNAKKVPDYETDSSLTSAEKRHFRVASWTKNVDLFNKEMIIIPICEESHWYLLIVVRPGAIFLPVKERRKKGEPFVIVLDSVGGKNGTAVKNMRRYLACEWNKKKCHGVESLTKLEEIGKSMNTVRPNKPEQENNSDCGIFLLQYVENVFQNVSAFLWPFLVNSRSKEWFTSEEVGGKRGEIAQLIKRLTEEQKPGEVIEFPEIEFTEKGS